MTDVTLESYTKAYNHRALVLKLKGRNINKKRGLFKRIFYLAKQFNTLTYHGCVQINNSQYDRRAEILTSHLINIELLKSACDRYLGDCKITSCVVDVSSTMPGLRINLEYTHDNVNWVQLNYDLVKDHSDNIYDIQALHFTLKDYTRKWWEQIKLNFDFEN